MTFTENVSLHGARVNTLRRWLPDAHVLVTFSGMAFRLKEESFTASVKGAGPLPWDRAYIPTGARPIGNLT